ncbi:MAG: hypothetical protein PVI20_09785 [Desulfobacteraceae bacterium]|jgi:hypothetical protein
MTERSFDDAFWADPFIQELSKDAKLLYAYAFTNQHCNQAGLYQITLKTISFETGIDLDSLPQLFESELKEKVVWYANHQVLWVKNFIRRQSKSPKFLIAVARCLEKIKDKKMVEELLLYNDTLLIPYEYPTNSIPIRPTTTTDLYTDTDTISDTDNKKTLPQNSDILAHLRSLSAWKTSKEDPDWLRTFITEFPSFSAADVRACRDKWDGKNPAKDKGDWKNRLRNWMKVEEKQNGERRTRTARRDIERGGRRDFTDYSDKPLR